MKKLFFLMTCLIASTTMFALEKTIENTFSESTYSKSVQTYTDTWENNSGTILTLVNFSNNQKKWTEVKCGRKTNKDTEYPSVATITTKSPLTQTITKVLVNVTATNNTYVNEAYLEVSADAAFTTPTKISFTLAVEELVIAIPAANQAANLYYRLTVDCKGGASSNGFVAISKISFVYEEATSEPTLVADETVDFGTVINAADFTEKKITVLGEALTTAPTYKLEKEATSPFSVTGTLGLTEGALTVTCTATEVGSYTDKLIITSGTANAEVVLSAVIAKVNTVAEANALADDTADEFVKGTVTKVVDKEFWIQDETAGILCYQYNHGLTAGEEVILKATKVTYKGIPELKTITVISHAAGTPIVPQALTIQEINENSADYIGELVALKEVTLTYDGTTAYLGDGSTTIKVHGVTLDQETLPADSKVDATLVLSSYDGKLQFRGLAEDITLTPNPGTGTALENVIEEAKAVKVIENGQLVIIKDGVRYSVLGSPLR